MHPADIAGLCSVVRVFHTNCSRQWGHGSVVVVSVGESDVGGAGRRVHVGVAVVGSIDGPGLLTIAVDHLTLGRAALYETILDNGKTLRATTTPEDLAVARSSDTPSIADIAASHRPTLETARIELDTSMDGLRRSGRRDILPHGLLSRAWLRFVEDDAEGARNDLDEAWEIAERGPMKLHMADIHLYRARLFHAVKPYPWKSPQEDLAAAEKLINECGYHRRDEELADAKQAILGSKHST